jgi:hypothetical protein
MGKADRMVTLAAFAVFGLAIQLDLVYNTLLGLMLAGLMVTFVQRARATYHALESGR